MFKVEYFFAPLLWLVVILLGMLGLYYLALIIVHLFGLIL